MSAVPEVGVAELPADANEVLDAMKAERAPMKA